MKTKQNDLVLEKFEKEQLSRKSMSLVTGGKYIVNYETKTGTLSVTYNDDGTIYSCKVKGIRIATDDVIALGDN